MDGFARRTGLSGAQGDPRRRYLWTDAFAVQTFFGLAGALGEPDYKTLALELIALVHDTLGRFHPDDERQGWISGLPESEGLIHPTAGGLRIGKELPERGPDQPFDQRLEWDRDGQYFHYLTRWFAALLEATARTGDDSYAVWAAELIRAGRSFIHHQGDRVGMYWKMSVDLSRPLVPSMGAHDPLEGLICTVRALQAAPVMASELTALMHEFEDMCVGRDWSTTDALGIGGLLLDTLKTAILVRSEPDLPAPIHPHRLAEDSLASLRAFARLNRPDGIAAQRLPFRECGLSLGLRTLYGAGAVLAEAGLSRDQLRPFIALADSIEAFWVNPDHQQPPTWSEHLDINAVTLAASLVADAEPLAFA